MLVSDDYASKVSEPTESSLNCISSPVSIPKAVILSVYIPMITTMRRKQIDTPFPQALAQRVAVVGLVPDYSFGSGPWPSRSFFGDFDLLKCLLGEPDLCWRSRVGMASQRKTLAIDHHHALCALSPFGLSDRWTPFFAGKKLASMNASSQSSTPLASNSERKALHISFRTSASYHSFRRRQQVEGSGYLSGRSFHRAPVLSIQRIPSKITRLSFLGRPPFGRGGGLGIKGSTLLPLLIGQVHDDVCSPDLPPAS